MKDLSLKHLIHQTFIIGIKGTSLTSEEIQLFKNENIGGVILFDRNFESLKQLHNLINHIQQLAIKSPDQKHMFIAVDMEGGRVQRLKSPFTTWPSMQKLGKHNSPSLAFDFASTMAKELKAIGINMNCAPCLDVLTCQENKVIGDRALSDQTDIVEKIGSAIVRGFIKEEIIPCGKHFPGHGSTITDSHLELPIADISLEMLEKNHLPPFLRVFRSKLPLLMTAHIKYSNIDSDWPATLSEKVIKGLARDKMRYRSLIISDDLDMKALRNHWSVQDIAVQAVKAGCNLLLYCNDFESPHIAADAIEKALINGDIEKKHIIENHQRVVKLKSQVPLKRFGYQEVLQIVGQTNYQALSQLIASNEKIKSKPSDTLHQ